MTEPAILLAAVLAPGVFYWWSGRHLVRRREDPALPERMVLRQQHASYIVVLSCVLLAYSAGTSYWFAFVGLVVGTWIGDYPSRRVVFDEPWTLGAYLLWHARFTTGFLGFWFALLFAPSIIHAADEWRWPVAWALALALGLWGQRYGETFLWLVRARPLTPPAEWAPVLERSHAPRPRLLEMPVPGGRFVNAFALASSRDASVLFSAPLLELLTPREQAAILAHEMAHLEHYDRRRCRIATVAGYTLVVLATFGAALALDWLGGGLLTIVWSVAFLIAVALRTSRQKAHETESDSRALALCQDADALISGLTKLTTAGRVPRRWSSELERYASHPSLARRLQAIRRAAGITSDAPSITDPLVVSTARPGARVIVDDHGVSWLSGLGTVDVSDPVLLRQMATASWSVPYTDLVELRVAASWWGGASLRLRDRAGVSRTVRVASADVQALQQRLDAVEDRLQPDVRLAQPPALVGRLTAAALWVTSIGALLPLGLVVGMIAVLRPSRPALAAVAGTAGACVLAVFGDLADGRHLIQAVSASGAVLVAALAAWLAAKQRTVDWRKADYLPVLIAAGLVLVVTCGQVAASLLWMRPSSSLAMQTLAGAPVLWASLGVIGCALMTAPGRAVRGGGVAVFVAAVLINLGIRIDDLDALSRTIAPPTAESRPLPRVATLALPAPGAPLRVSPFGSRVAVGQRSSPRDADRRFLVLGVAGGRTEVEAHDLYFIDEGNALVATNAAEGTTLQHIEFADRSEAVSGWRIVVAGIRDLRLSSVRDSGWAGVGHDAKTDARIAVVGKIGVTDFTRRPLHGDDDEEIDGPVALTPDGRALRTVSDIPSLARLSWPGLLYMGRLPRETRVWRVDREREPYVIASLPAHASCQLVGRELGTVICVGTDRSQTLIWRFDVATPPTAPLIVPGVTWRSAVGRDGHRVALWSEDEVLIVDLDSARASRWNMSAAAGYPIDLVPAGDRLVALTYSSTGASIQVYDAR